MGEYNYSIKGEVGEKMARQDLILITAPFDTVKEFEKIVEQNRPQLIKTAMRVVHDQETAEDIVQEALLKAYKHLQARKVYLMPQKRAARTVADMARRENPKKKREKSRNQGADPEEIKNPVAYLHKIVYNTACNYYYSKNKLKRHELQLSALREEKIRTFEDPLASVLKTEEAEELHALVKLLPLLYSRAVELRYFDEQSYQTIASVLKCPIGTAKNGASRGVQMLGETLRGERVIKNGKMIKLRNRLVKQH